MVSGGGSAQVDPPGGNAIMPPGHRATMWGVPVWFPTSPLKAIRAKAPNAKVEFDPGTDLDSSASLAKGADVAIVFAWRAESEGADAPNMSLPGNQNDLIAKVAAANPNTIVVLETGNPVTMPWLNQVSGILEVWFAGSSGDKALASILFGDVNPSGKLPITFPRSEADLPHPTINKPDPAVQPHGPDAWRQTLEGIPAFQTKYDEGLKVGYKWYDAEKKPVLFPFGYGLSYTTFTYSGLNVTSGERATVSFTVKNTGKRAGTEIAQVYASLPQSAGEPPNRLVGWTRVDLAPGESKQATVTVNRDRLSVFDEETDSWKLPAGQYTIRVGASSRDLPLEQAISFEK